MAENKMVRLELIAACLERKGKEKCRTPFEYDFHFFA